MSELLTILVGDVRDKLREIPDESVHCVVTSPPYWGLRDYGVPGQLGLEDTPEQHVEAMVEVFREVRRVLRSDGTLWLNYGDCYASARAGHTLTPQNGVVPASRRGEGAYGTPSTAKEKGRRGGSRDALYIGLKHKDLVMMPARIALALQADGWWLRSDIIWAKPNTMPESVTDRPTSAHEHIFLMTKSARYFYDAEAVREKATERPSGNHRRVLGEERGNTGAGAHRGASIPYQPDGTGRNLRNVWTIPTQPFPEAHFATFPEELASRCIKAGTSAKGVCENCGAPWERHTGEAPGPIWLPRCKCFLGKGVPDDTRFYPIAPATVLDPFGGSGTTAVAAIKDGRRATIVELNPTYADIASRRINDAAGLFL